MMNKLFQFLEWFSNRKTWKKIVMSLSCVVVFITAYALILPAITVENKLICTTEEHTHSDACYSTQATLICGKEDDPDHVHDESCYEYEQVLVCEVPEHTHTEECYETVTDAIVDEITGNDETVTPVQKSETEVEEVKESEEETDEKEEKEEEVQEFELTAALSDGNTVTVKGTSEVLPEEVENIEKLSLTAKLLDDEKVDDLMEDVCEEETPSDIYTLYDIKLYYDGKEIEPTGELTLTITGIEDVENVENVEFFHLDEKNNRKEDMSFDLSADGTITVETDHFSVYGVTTSYASGYAIGSLNYDHDDLSGNLYLSNDVSTSKTITITKDTVLNLNGHKLTYTGSNSLFVIKSGTLTIKDGQETAETITTATVENNYANTATYSNGTLTYYVTVPTVNSSDKTTTTETVEKHVVKAAGLIDCTNAKCTPIVIQGGSFTLESGMIAGGKYRAIEAQSGYSTINLKGGYICGFTNNSGSAMNDGGAAIKATKGTINLTGSVIAGNTNNVGNGGALCLTNTTFKMSGGIISGNKNTTTNMEYGRNGGGGIYTSGGTVTLSDKGYITNNTCAACSGSNSWNSRGGGIMLDGTTMTMDGGYVTGNKSDGGSGGIGSKNEGYSKFTMNNGYVSSNVAVTNEGGGIGLMYTDTAYLKGGYITNNSTLTTRDWGGGGVFIAQGGTMYASSVVITENSANGYGGGVAGCSTGHVYAIETTESEAAIFGNTAAGTNMSGDTSSKNEDHIYAYSSEVFTSNGYQDFFSCHDSAVSGAMMNGGTENWSGSADNQAVSLNNNTDVLTSQNVMGLTANPSETDQTNAKSAAKLYITGNSSNTHGGGILSNGYLFLGSTDKRTVPSQLKVDGTKFYFKTDGTKLQLGDLKFKFYVTDENGNRVATGENDSGGNIAFDNVLRFTEAGTYVYYVQEDESSATAGVICDSTIYRYTVKTELKESSNYTYEQGKAFTVQQVQITSITVDSSNGNGTWKNVYTKTSGISNSESSILTLYTPTFTNYKQDKITLKVTKKWNDGDSTNVSHPSVTVHLKQDGKIVEGQDQKLSSSNNWTATWTNLDGNYNYTVSEDLVSGYTATYDYITSTAGNDYWVPVEAGETISSTDEYILVYPVTNSQGVTNYYVLNADNWSDYGNIKYSDSFTCVSGGANLKIGSKTYSTYLAGSKIKSSSIFVSSSLKREKATYTTFMNKSTGKWLSYYNGDSIVPDPYENNSFQTSFSNGYLKMGSSSLNNDPDLSTSRYLTISISNGVQYLRFTNSSSAAIKVYKRVYDFSDLSYEAVITNTSNKLLSYSLDITKTNKTDDESKKVVLKDATFNLLDSNGNTLKFVQNSDGYYVPSTDSKASSDLITNTNGMIRIKNLSADTYTLKETSAPEGYDLAEDQSVTLGESDETSVSVTVEDAVTSYELPKTGGMGTTMIYIAGGGMMLAAAILLISKKRMK